MCMRIDRRELLRAGSVGAAGVLLRPSFDGETVRVQGPSSSVPPPTVTPFPKALVFDTFGTVVDWRGSIVEEGAAWGKTKGVEIDWAHFADRWRDGYFPSLERVRKGELPWTKLDVLNRMLLEDVLKEFRIVGLTEQEKDHWNRVWHRLKPWPDSIPGLTRLKKKYTIAPLSNGNFALLTNMAKHAGLPWDAILSAELALPAKRTRNWRQSRQSQPGRVRRRGKRPG